MIWFKHENINFCALLFFTIRQRIHEQTSGGMVLWAAPLVCLPLIVPSFKVLPNCNTTSIVLKSKNNCFVKLSVSQHYNIAIECQCQHFVRRLDSEPTTVFTAQQLHTKMHLLSYKMFVFYTSTLSPAGTKWHENTDQSKSSVTLYIVIWLVTSETVISA